MPTGDFPTISQVSYGGASSTAFHTSDNHSGQLQWGDGSRVNPAITSLINTTTTTSTEDTEMTDRRLVRVLVVDTEENLPVEDALLYDSKEIFTDKTDQELYFDVPMQELLKAHNDKRIKVLDKSVKERKEYLEPARIRDLDMVVIAIAEF